MQSNKVGLEPGFAESSRKLFQNALGTHRIAMRDWVWKSPGDSQPQLEPRTGALPPLQQLHPWAWSPVRLRPGWGGALLQAGSGRLGRADPLSSPTGKTRFSWSRQREGGNRLVTSLGAFRGPQSPQPPLLAQLRGSLLPRQPRRRVAPRGHTWAPPPVLQLWHRGASMGEERESDYEGRKEDPSPAQHSIRCQGPQPRAWTVSSSCLLPLSPHRPEKPGAAVLRRSQAETRTWDGGSVGESQRTSQPATPSSARPAWAGSAAPLDPSMGFGPGPATASWPPPSHSIAVGSSLQIGYLCWAAGPRPGPKPMRRVEPANSDPGCVSTGLGATRACLRLWGFWLRLSSQRARAGSPAPPRWVSEHDWGRPLPCWLSAKALPPLWVSSLQNIGPFLLGKMGTPRSLPTASLRSTMKHRMGHGGVSQALCGNGNLDENSPFLRRRADGQERTSTTGSNLCSTAKML